MANYFIGHIFCKMGFSYELISILHQFLRIAQNMHISLEFCVFLFFHNSFSKIILFNDSNHLHNDGYSLSRKKKNGECSPFFFVLCVRD